MKNIINYYYQINIENIHLSKGIYYFTYMNNNYMFIPYTKDYMFLNYLYILNQIILKNNIYYHEIILNKDKLPYLFIDGKCYCLIKESNKINDRINFYDITFQKIKIDNNLKRLIRFPWTSLWLLSAILHNFFYQHLKYKKLSCTFYIKIITSWFFSR